VIYKLRRIDWEVSIYRSTTRRITTINAITILTLDLGQVQDDAIKAKSGDWHGVLERAIELAAI
jgi:hypothetical protein